MLFPPRYASLLSVLLLSLASFATARPGIVDDSPSLWRKRDSDLTCPSAGSNAYTKCFELTYSQIKKGCTPDQAITLGFLTSFKLDFWICYNQQTGTLYIDEQVYTGVGWLLDIIISIQYQNTGSCTCTDPWKPPSWDKKGKSQCIPPPAQCCPGYTNCNGCCQPWGKDCSTYSKTKHGRRDLEVCKAGQTKCYSGSGSFDCIDTTADVESCGGCLFQSPQAKWNAAFVAGEDCTEIPFVSAVQCRQGRCVVEKCTASHKLDRATNSCVPLKLGALKMQKYRLSDAA